MTLIFEHEAAQALPLPEEELAGQVIEAALEHEGCPYETQISLTVTDSGAIREMNRDFRGIDAPTDVLSFPMLSFQAPGDFSFAEENELLFECFDPESGELLLGDIVVNADRVRSQAEEYGHSLKREYAFLIAHSMLHLLGYDHETPQEAAQMEQCQEEILAGLRITRG